MQRRLFRRALKTLCIIVASIILGTLLLMISYLLPTGRMVGHVLESRDMLLKEGDYPSWGAIYTIGDNYSDGVMLSRATYNQSQSLLYKTLLNPGMYAEDQDSYIASVVNAHQSDVETYEKTYARYWHGYLIFLKPMLILFNVGEIRTVNTIIQLLALLFCTTLIVKCIGKRYILFVATAVAFINPVTTAHSFQFACIYYITLATIICMCLRPQLFFEGGRIYELFLVNGILCAYFDLLTYPLVALGIPLIMGTLMEASRDGKASFKTMAGSAIGWTVGYGGMWAGKWVIASVMTEENVIQSAVGKIASRTDNILANQESLSRLDGIKRNWTVINKSPLMVFVVLLILAIIVYGIISKSARKPDKKTIAKLSLIAILPLVWYVIVLDHSVQHTFIAWRNYAVLVAAILAILLYVFRGKKRERIEKNSTEKT